MRSNIVVHAPYVINLAASDRALRRRSVDLLADQLERADRLGAAGVVVHPGAHTGDGVDVGVRRVVTSALEALERSDASSRLLLEVTAGQGSTLGSSLQELGAMLDGLPQRAHRNLLGHRAPVGCWYRPGVGGRVPADVVGHGRRHGPIGPGRHPPERHRRRTGSPTRPTREDRARRARHGDLRAVGARSSPRGSTDGAGNSERRRPGELGSRSARCAAVAQALSPSP